MVTDERLHLLDNLQNLLEDQVKLAHRGNVSGVEALTELSDSLVGEIAERGGLESTEFENQRKRLQELYKDLCLALEAQKAETAEQLRKIRKGRKTLGVYRSNI